MGLPAATASASRSPRPLNLVVGPTGGNPSRSSGRTTPPTRLASRSSAAEHQHPRSLGQRVLGGCTTSTAFSLRATAAANPLVHRWGLRDVHVRVRAVNSAGASGWTARARATIGVPAIARPCRQARPWPWLSTGQFVGPDRLLVTHGGRSATVPRRWARSRTPTRQQAYSVTHGDRHQGNAVCSTTVTVGPAPYVPVAPSGVTATSTVKQRRPEVVGAGTAGDLVPRVPLQRLVVHPVHPGGDAADRPDDVHRYDRQVGHPYRYYVAACSTVTLASRSSQSEADDGDHDSRNLQRVLAGRQILRHDGGCRDRDRRPAGDCRRGHRPDRALNLELRLQQQRPPSRLSRGQTTRPTRRLRVERCTRIVHDVRPSPSSARRSPTSGPGTTRSAAVPVPRQASTPQARRRTRLRSTPNNGAPSAVIAPIALRPPRSVTFDGSVSGLDFGTVVKWEWSYGDGATALGAIDTRTHSGHLLGHADGDGQPRQHRLCPHHRDGGRTAARRAGEPRPPRR